MINPLAAHAAAYSETGNSFSARRGRPRFPFPQASAKQGLVFRIQISGGQWRRVGRGDRHGRRIAGFRRASLGAGSGSGGAAADFAKCIVFSIGIGEVWADVRVTGASGVISGGAGACGAIDSPEISGRPGLPGSRFAMGGLRLQPSRFGYFQESNRNVSRRKSIRPRETKQ